MDAEQDMTLEPRTLPCEWPLDDLLALPYHKVQDGVTAFVQRVTERYFYTATAARLRDELDRARRVLTETLDALARVGHTSAMVRGAVFRGIGGDVAD